MKILTPLLHEVVEYHARLTPSAPAIFSPQGNLCYGELAARIDQIARALVRAGVEPELRVGLHLERSPDMIAALFAVLKAGGICVPLDPLLPSERAAMMAADVEVRVLVATRSALRTSPAPAPAARVVLLEEVGEAPDDRPLDEIRPAQAAYIAFRSAPTGRPRGVVLEHRNLLPLHEWASSAFTPEECGRVLAANALGSDRFLLEIILAFASGGAVVLVSSARELLLGVPSESPTLMLGDSGTIDTLFGAQVIPSSVKTIVVSGDILPFPLAKRLYAETAIEQLIQCWGLPEAAFVSAFSRVPRLVSSDLSLGTAIDGHALYLLDARMQPVAPGLPGEIWCGGAGLARGTKFAPNPFGDSPLMLCTGDLAVLGEEGEMRYVGRTDEQVAFAGERLELGDIESAVRSYSGVVDAALVVKESAGCKRFALFVVWNEPQALTLADIQRWLVRYLPKSWFPATLYIVEQLPRDANGRFDRIALQRVARERPAGDTPYEAPRSEIERLVSGVFSEVLGIDQVGIHDDFQALGGSAPMVSRLMERLRAMFAMNLRILEEAGYGRALLTVFWEQPTVASLAAFLNQGAPSKVSVAPDAQCLQRGAPNRPPVFLLHGVIDGEGFYVWSLARALGPEQGIYAFPPHGIAGAPVPRTVEEMAAGYLAQVRSIQPNGPYHFAGYCNGAIVAYEMACRLQEQGERVSTLLLVAAPGHTIPYAGLKRQMMRLRTICSIDEDRMLEYFVALNRKITWWKKQFRLGFRLPALFSQTLPGREPAIASRASEEDRISPQYRARVDALDFALDAYVPQPYHDIVSLVFGANDPYARDFKPEREWSRVASQLRYEEVSGDHFFIEEKPELLLEHFRLS
jgi:acyl-coenzyme A synthetase/AMP-(fatty) acid ligase/thioesterase domain-containing protein